MPNTVANTTATETAALAIVANEKPAKAPKAKPAVKPAGETTAATVKPAVEAKPDAAAAKREAIKADRATITALYAVFETARLSVPVKPTVGYKAVLATAHPIARNPSARQAAAIAAAFSAAGKKLIDGNTAPRTFDRDGRGFIIETGVLRDAISAGIITVSGDTPATEIIKLAKNASKTIAGLIGSAAIKAGKLA